MKIIITGASGFVGKNLTNYLQNRDREVVSLSLRGLDWIDNIPVDGLSIIHLAGKAHDTSNTSQSEAYFKINRDLTIEIFTKFLNSEIRDFFYFSSVKAVADSVDGILSEDIVGNPLTPYGQSKWEAEQYLQNQQLPHGKRLFIIRPCMIHGPGNKGNLNLLYQVVEKGLPWPLASFHNQRSFLGIDNLCFLIENMLANTSLTSGIYNFADDEVISTNELVSIVAYAIGEKAKLWNIPRSFIETVVKIGDVLPLPLNSERLKKLTESYVVSNNKVKTALDIKKLPLTAQEGLVRTVQSFKIKK